ncbi:hypothetical protein D0B54_07325 [Solimonas sp. K1W22B-7]|nr:hypothetical protein D0B54_07325 [Solimonas sp. K1W22B-7]
MDLGTIKSVGIENIGDVKEHSINNQFGFVSHFVRFTNGGELEFAYNAQGQIVKFEARNLQTVVQNGERLMFRVSSKQ